MTYQVSGDADSLGKLMDEGVYEAVKPTIDDIETAIEILCMFNVYEVDGEEDETAQSLANVIAMLARQAHSKAHRKAVNKAKRDYAKEHGLKVSQVRYNPKKVS